MITNDRQVLDDSGHGMETLSALFDGELHGDAARFAMKRLGHDPQWQRAFGNWQLLGDALRGQAGRVAPRDFAARVATAVASEPGLDAAQAPANVSSTTAPATAVTRRKWIGGAALAASVAMVAMFIARPFSQDPGLPVSVEPAPAGLVVNPARVPPQGPDAATPAVPDGALPLGASAVAVVQAPRRAGERRSRGQSQRVALHASRRQMATPAIASSGAATTMAIVDPLPHAGINPFRAPHVEAVSRPWPRAVLSGSGGGGAFTASFVTSASGSPSFYPFEPRLPAATDASIAPKHDMDER